MSKKSKTIVGVVLVIAVLLIAVGYAMISSITLNINGTASGDGNQENFKVLFTDVTKSSENVEASVSGLTGTMKVTGLTTLGDEETATFTIANQSTDINANVSAVIDPNTAINTEYFDISFTGGNETINAGSTSTITVTVRLVKTPIEDVSTSFNIKLTAEPTSK